LPDYNLDGVYASGVNFEQDVVLGTDRVWYVAVRYYFVATEAGQECGLHEISPFALCVIIEQ
jgi:hypothetical protein